MNKFLTLVLLFPCFAFGATIGKNDAPLAAPAQAASNPDSSGLHDKLVADLNAAIAGAQASHDAMAPVRAKCYQTLLNHAGDLTSPAAPVGPISAFERAAELIESADSGVPVDIRADCSALVVRAREILIKFGLAGAAVLK